jgi:hypothetical protein
MTNRIHERQMRESHPARVGVGVVALHPPAFWDQVVEI